VRSAHHIGRQAERLGHNPRLLPGQDVRADTESQKNDDADAKAIAEATSHPTMREVRARWCINGSFRSCAVNVRAGSDNAPLL